MFLYNLTIKDIDFSKRVLIFYKENISEYISENISEYFCVTSMAKPLRKILLVDDDEDALVIANYSLKALVDVEVHSVRSGEEAVKIALEFLPDLILLDVKMPKMDGITTFNALNAFSLLSKTVIVFFTANSEDEEIKKFLDLGALDVIVKPFDVHTFADTVRLIWDRCNDD